MRVAFSDPQGKRFWRMVPMAGPFALLVLACFGPFGPGDSILTGVLAIGLLHVVGLLQLRQRRRRQAELVTGHGFVEIRKAGTRSQRIDARSIVGGTTARTANGVVFTLAHAKRDQPLTLEVESDADAERVRHALGIGHGGFGTVGWRTTPSAARVAAFWGRMFTFGIASAVALTGFFVGPEAAAAVGGMLSHFALACFILGLLDISGGHATPSVVMAAEGLRVMTRQGWFTLPYDHILGVEPLAGALRLRVPPPYNAVDVAISGTFVGDGLGSEERDAMIKQLRSAADRARGLGASKYDVTGRVDVLRRKGQSPREWLRRLDMAGRMLESSTAGYRDHPLETCDLWTILEDPEAEADLRSAAARVLRHSPRPETRTRIAAAVAAVRDDATNRRLRIAILDDVDNASEELAALDAQDHHSLRARAAHHR